MEEEKQPDMEDIDAVSDYVTNVLKKRGRPPKRVEDLLKPLLEEKKEVTEEPKEYVKKKEETKILTEEELVKDSREIQKELSNEDNTVNFAILRLERKMEFVEEWCRKLEEHAKFFFRHIQSIEHENKTLWLQSFNAVADALGSPEASARAKQVYVWWQDIKKGRDWSIYRSEDKLAHAEKVIEALNLGNDAWEIRNEEKIKPALEDTQEKVRKIFYPEYTI